MNRYFPNDSLKKIFGCNIIANNGVYRYVSLKYGDLPFKIDSIKCIFYVMQNISFLLDIHTKMHQ